MHVEPEQRPNDAPGAARPILIDREIANGVHILIVCVASYENEELEALPGAVETAKRLENFWRNCVFKDRSLASLDILVSHDEEISFRDDDGEPFKPLPASKESIQSAFKAWRDRVKPDSLAILHWIGHGSAYKVLAGPSNPTVLYCSDVNSRGQSRGFDVDAMTGAIGSALEAPSVLFIDACRSEVDRRDFGKPTSFGSPLDTDGAGPYWPELYHLNHLTFSTYCARPDVQLGPALGGAFMSEAFLHSLRGIGAVARPGTAGFPVTTDGVKHAANFIFASFLRNHGIEAPNQEFIHHKAGHLANNRFPIVLAARQRGVKQIDDDRSAMEAGCMVEQPDGAPVTPGPWKAPAGWEVHLDFASNYRAYPLISGEVEPQSVGVKFDVDKWDCDSPVSLTNRGES